MCYNGCDVLCGGVRTTREKEVREQGSCHDVDQNAARKCRVEEGLGCNISGDILAYHLEQQTTTPFLLLNSDHFVYRVLCGVSMSAKTTMIDIKDYLRVCQGRYDKNAFVEDECQDIEEQL